MRSVTYLLVVDFCIADSDCDSLVELHADLVEHLLDGAWNDTSLLEIVGETQHRECLSRTSLSITHDGAVVPSNNIRHDLCRGQIEYIILRGIEHDLVELEAPGIQLIVHCAVVFFVDLDIELLQEK